MTLVQGLTIGFIAMTAVAFTAIWYGFKLTAKMNSDAYRREQAFAYLREQREKAVF